MLGRTTAPPDGERLGMIGTDFQKCLFAVNVSDMFLIQS